MLKACLNTDETHSLTCQNNTIVMAILCLDKWSQKNNLEFTVCTDSCEGILPLTKQTCCTSSWSPVLKLSYLVICHGQQAGQEQDSLQNTGLWGNRPHRLPTNAICGKVSPNVFCFFVRTMPTDYSESTMVLLMETPEEVSWHSLCWECCWSAGKTHICWGVCAHHFGVTWGDVTWLKPLLDCRTTGILESLDPMNHWIEWNYWL